MALHLSPNISVSTSQSGRYKNIKIAEPGARVDGGKQPVTLRGKVLGRRHSAWSA